MDNTNNNQYNNKTQDDVTAEKVTEDLLNTKDTISVGISIFVLILLIGFVYKYNPFTLFITSLILAKRLQYSLILFIFLIITFLIYFFNPFQLATNFFGITTLIIISLATLLFSSVLWYVLRYSSNTPNIAVEETPKPLFAYFLKGFMVIISIAISAALIWGITAVITYLQDASSIATSVVNFFIVVTIFGLIYQILKKNTYVQSSPIVRLITNIFLFIPCIFVNSIDYIVSTYYTEKARTTRTELILFIISIVLIALYFLIPILTNFILTTIQGGNTLLSSPVSTNTPYTLGDYMSLNDIDKKETDIEYNYNYGISLWYYLDALPPNTTSAYDRYTSIFDYGSKPNILYNATNNTLIVVVKIKDLTNTMIEKSNFEVYDDDSVIIYKNKNVFLQKWNNIIINYEGGTLDIFSNGELMSSVKNIVPYMNLDTIVTGTNNGINGYICNVVYYKKPLDVSTISLLYNSVKNKTPPVPAFSKSNSKLIDSNTS